MSILYTSSSSAFPTTSLGFTICGEIFVYVTFFANPTIEVVTFCLHGWCMQGVFLLPVFTRPDHKCQEFMRRNACVHRLDLSLYSHPKEVLENGVRTLVNLVNLVWDRETQWQNHIYQLCDTKNQELVLTGAVGMFTWQLGSFTPKNLTFFF